MVKVERESLDFSGCEWESCVICGAPTPYWYSVKDVPLCPDCALVSPHDQIPSKEEWIIKG